MATSNPFDSHGDAIPAIIAEDSSASNTIDGEDDKAVLDKNPFGDTEESTIVSECVPANNPVNPFDDSDGESAGVSPIVAVQPASVISQTAEAATPVISAKPPPANIPLPVMVKGYECDTHKIALTQAVDMLANVGLLPDLVKASLHNTKDIVASFKILSERVVDVCSKDPFGTAATLWKAPLAVRIGSWMPHRDPGTGTDHTEYYISVCNVRNGENYQISKRYSDFHALYLSIYSHLVNGFAKGMQNLFPDNRVTTWFSRESDQLRNSRREYLDGWLREVCLNAVVMINLDARNKIYDFLEVDKRLRIAVYKR